MNADILIISLLVAPLFATLGSVLFHKAPDLRESVTLLSAIASFFLATMLCRQLTNGADMELTLFQIAQGLGVTFKIEPLGGLFAAIASGLWILNSIYSIGYMRGNNEGNQSRFYACFGLAISGAMGVAMAGNLFTLFIFYEILTLSTYPLVAHKGDEKARKGARIYLSMLLGTSIGFLLVAIIWTHAIMGHTDFVMGGLLAGKLSPFLSSILLILFVFGIGKAALMPVHFWLPSAMVAPTPVSALLHAVAVVKAGVFAVLKVCIYIFGTDLLLITPSRDALLLLGGATIIIASLIAIKQDNLKARLAYSTVSQLAYVTVGALIAGPIGFAAGAIQILAHAFAKITLFMCAGAIYVATGVTEISQMHGLGKRMPVVFGAYFIAALSIIGLPPLIGAWPKFSLLSASYSMNEAWLFWVFLGSTLLNIAYLLPVAVRGFMPLTEVEPPAFKHPKGAPIFVVFPLLITAIGCLLMFFMVGSVSNFLSPVFQ